MTNDDGTHSGSRNVANKLTLHTVQNPKKQKSELLAQLRYRPQQKCINPGRHIAMATEFFFFGDA